MVPAGEWDRTSSRGARQRRWSRAVVPGSAAIADEDPAPLAEEPSGLTWRFCSPQVAGIDRR